MPLSVLLVAMKSPNNNDNNDNNRSSSSSSSNSSNNTTTTTTTTTNNNDNDNNNTYTANNNSRHNRGQVAEEAVEARQGRREALAPRQQEVVELLDPAGPPLDAQLLGHGAIFRRGFSSIRLLVLDVRELSSMFFDYRELFQCFVSFWEKSPAKEKTCPGAAP